jgi:trimeric autotransporter adhesin
VTLLQYFQQQLTIYQAARSAAQADLAAAQTSLTAATAKVTADQQALAATAASVAATRAALAVEVNPADAAALVADIEALLITQHRQQGTLLDDLDAQSAAQAAAEAASASVAQAQTEVAAITATTADVTADDAQRTTLKNAIGVPPLSTLQGDATTFLASATVTNATTRIGANFPAALMTIGDKRHDRRVSRISVLQTSVKNAEDALGAAYATDSGLAGQAEQKRIMFERAQDALATYVATAASRYAQATTVMTALNAIQVAPPGSVPDVLTDAEKAEVTARTPAGAAAESTAETLDTDLGAVFTAQDALDAQILAAIAANPDTVDSDPTVATTRTAIATAQGAFNTALTAFAGANKTDLDRWETAIPDAAWSVLATYENGLDALTELSATSAAALATAMDVAEGNYAAALAAAAVADRKAARFAAAIALRRQWLDAVRATVNTRMLSAIRGDSY